MKEAGQNRIRAFAFIISICLAICFSFLFISSHESSANAKDQCHIELDGKINPNNAHIASLVRLPGIGFLRAEAIVAYRDEFSRKNGKGPAFRNCNDLQRVKGIGPKTTQNISPWLKFE